MSASIITVSLNPTIDRVIEVDDFTVGAHQVGREILRTPGGKAVNVSRVLARLGVRSIATGFLGADNRNYFDSFLQCAQVADEFFVLPGRTRENVTVVDRRSNQETHIRDIGLEVDARNLARLKKKLQLMSRADSIVIFSGSLPPGVGPGDLLEMVQMCIASGARVVVDTSGEALLAVAGQRLWLVKPNSLELSTLTAEKFHTPEAEIAAARKLAGRVETVLFTRGDQGSYLFAEGLALHGHVPVEPHCIRSTVGCGDALLGAFVAGVQRKGDLRRVFADAVACASASACTASPAEFELDLMNELRAQVRVQELPPKP